MTSVREWTGRWPLVVGRWLNAELRSAWTVEGGRPHVVRGGAERGDDLGGSFVQRGHGAGGGFDPVWPSGALLDRGGDYARAQRFGKQQAIAGLGAAVGKYFFRIDEAGHGISELGFLVADAVAAHDCALRLHHL